MTLFHDRVMSKIKDIDGNERDSEKETEEGESSSHSTSELLHHHPPSNFGPRSMFHLGISFHFPDVQSSPVKIAPKSLKGTGGYPSRKVQNPAVCSGYPHAPLPPNKFGIMNRPTPDYRKDAGSVAPLKEEGQIFPLKCSFAYCSHACLQVSPCPSASIHTWHQAPRRLLYHAADMQSAASKSTGSLETTRVPFELSSLLRG